MNNERGRLIGIAYRMLGSYSDAEDAASEALVRWYRLTDAERDAVDVPAAWLTRVVGRICLDMLGSARVRRENYVGQWLREPVRGLDPESSAAADPADRVAQQESVTLALLVVLESLGPAQRVAFVLHDAFAVPFDEIATVLDRSPAACRQLASAARTHVHSRHRSIADPIEHDRVVRAFASASAGGDIASLVSVLARRHLGQRRRRPRIRGPQCRPRIRSSRSLRPRHHCQVHRPRVVDRTRQRPVGHRHPARRRGVRSHRVRRHRVRHRRRRGLQHLDRAESGQTPALGLTPAIHSARLRRQRVEGRTARSASSLENQVDTR
ncbi:sigma factor [Rhodococcus sp. SBT000017]|uniref:sigma factor n=1 Tax=Rhodococcus sp. SBT000017 TaxID=1803385 RepID=UPI00217E7D8C|nr:sigma factor [Rhodococcus sp. SBT000017]